MYASLPFPQPGNFVSGILITVFAIFSVTGCDSLLDDRVDDNIENGHILFELKSNNSLLNTPLSNNNHGHNGLIVAEINFFIEELELDGKNGTKDFKREGIVVTLRNNGNLISLPDLQIPAGRYDEFELEIDKPGSGYLTAGSGLNDESDHSSFVVKGIYNDEEFIFRTDKEFELEKDLKPPLIISDTGPSVLRIVIDTDRWFAAKDGSTLDPNDRNKHKQILKNIKHSFEVTTAGQNN